MTGRRLPFLGASAPFPLPLVVQLVNDSSGVCWESVYSAQNKPLNDSAGLLARHEGIPRPNVILITTDDQRSDTVGYMPAVVQEIASKGVTFENMFIPNPVCQPSRASILTGNHSHTHGVLTNSMPLNFLGPDQQTIPVWLRSQGYRTGFFGKYIGYTASCGATSCPVPPGWDEWDALILEGYFDYDMSENGSIVDYGSTPDDYSTDVLRDKALAFIDAHPDEPIYVHFAPMAPHGGTVSSGYLPVPAPRHFNSLLGIAPWRPVSYMEPDVSDKPLLIQALPRALPAVNVAYNDAYRRTGLESLSAADEAIAAILGRLEQQGRLTDTLIIFTSDNGYSHGEHRWFGKLCPYEECIRVPLAMRYPRVLRDRPGSRNELVESIDIAPTIVEWARVPSDRVPPVDGRSLVGVAERTQGIWRDAVLLEQWMGRYSGIRTTQWKYVQHETGEHELYDLVNDPYELTSVAGLLPAIESDLQERIVELGGSLP
jgi:arylsulfatase A-like enzyme